jgi:plasmid stabilization system protein ParE
VARVVYSGNALANREQSFQFLANDAPDAARADVRAIQSAVDRRADHPLIGRIVTAELRELIISYGRTGYVALYRFLPARREVRILAIRHQRDLDYP